MPTTRDLFGGLECIRVWVTVDVPQTPEATERIVQVRLAIANGRSLTWSTRCERYAPEESILLAVSKGVGLLEHTQAPFTLSSISDAMNSMFLVWLDPF